MGIHSHPHRLLRRLTTEDAEDTTEKSLRARAARYRQARPAHRPDATRRTRDGKHI